MSKDNEWRAADEVARTSSGPTSVFDWEEAVDRHYIPAMARAAERYRKALLPIVASPHLAPG